MNDRQTMPTDGNLTPLYGYDLTEEIYKVGSMVWDTDALAWIKAEQATLNADNLQINVAFPATFPDNVTSKYKYSDTDDTYFGFLAADGSWYISKDITTGMRYCKGADSYAANWANRANLTYDLFNIAFS